MQRIFLTVATAIAFTIASAAALAADMPRPVYKTPPPAPSYFSWTGFYIGLHGGGAWTDTDWFYPCSATNVPQPPCARQQGGHSAAGWLAGGQVGFNYQMGQWVLGLEAEFSAARLQANSVDSLFPTDVLHSRTNFIGTVAPRLGWAWDRALLYAKGGAAWINDDYALSGAPGVLADEGVITETASAMRWGWMAGIGAEYAFAQNWSAKLEYNYLDFGTERVTFNSNGVIPGQLPFDDDVRRKIQTVKVGLNYRFDWGGPVRY